MSVIDIFSLKKLLKNCLENSYRVMIKITCYYFVKFICEKEILIKINIKKWVNVLIIELNFFLFFQKLRNAHIFLVALSGLEEKDQDLRKHQPVCYIMNH